MTSANQSIQELPATTVVDITTVNLPLAFNAPSEDDQYHPVVAYGQYRRMNNWLIDRKISHTFHWHDTGRYTPDSITIDHLHALAFKLTFYDSF